MDIEVVDVRTGAGTEFQLAVDRHASDGVTQAARCENYSAPLSVEMLLRAVAPGATVLDLGAHIGSFSVAAAARGYHVIAVEAGADNVELLKESVRSHAVHRTGPP